MTNSPHPPNRSPQSRSYRPITFDDLPKPVTSSAQGFSTLLSPATRWAAAPVFGFICFYIEKMPAFAPIMVLVLLTCLLARLNEDLRKIVAVPLVLSGIKLSFGLVVQATHPGLLSAMSHDPDDCFLWLPMFFSGCLLFIPKRESATFKIVLAASCVLLASGLLPGQAFVAIFYMLDYLLFIGIIVGMFIDLASYSSARTGQRLADAS